jgi:O-antigen/teichoic acid export membrane protein
MANTHSEAHFATDHLLQGLKARTVSSGIVTTLLQAALMVVNLGSVVIMARLLAPQDFGLIAMVFSVMTFFQVFIEAGLSTATVQKQGITHTQVSNLFWVNVALGGMITLFLVFSAPAIAWFYGEPRLIAITLALSVTFLLTSATVQHQALLKRQMRFKAIAMIRIASTSIGVILGIAMASLDFGYWSLVGIQLSTPIVAVLATWMICNWRPQFPEKDSGTWFLLSFGANLTASGFLWSLAKGLDGVLIGKWFGSEALGLYSRAGALLIRPLEQAIAPLEAIFVPTFSRLQDQPERYRRIVFQVYDFLAICSLPFSGMLLALAQPLILVVLGPKWEAAVPIFAALSLYALYQPMILVAGWLLSSQGRGKDFLLLSCFTSSVTVMSYLVGSGFGPVGVAMSFSVSCLTIQLPVTYWIAGRSGLITAKDLWMLFIKHLPLWAVVSSTTWLVRLLVEDSTPLAQLSIGTSVGLIAGITVLCCYPPSRRAARNVIDVTQTWLRNRAAIPGQA